MKNIITLMFITLMLNNYSRAQVTLIPDSNFEQALINLGLDITLDGSVMTANIDTVTYLNVVALNISSLTGIEDFTDLIDLRCYNNQLTNLDVTQNTALTYLNFWGNQITSIDVSQNIDLTDLVCMNNQLSSLDVTQNMALTDVACYNNLLTSLDVTGVNTLEWLTCQDNLLTSLDVTQSLGLTELTCQNNNLTSLDLSQNIVLHGMSCSGNQLTCLNVKNGNNNNLLLGWFGADNNPNLTCIEVDDVAYSNTNWTLIDAGASFSTNCNNSCSSFVGISENIDLESIIIYPNPSKTGVIHLTKDAKESTIRVLTIEGKEVSFNANKRIIDISNNDKGVYIIVIEGKNYKYIFN